MARTEVILVGTVHGDPQGYQRGLKVLNHWRPRVVTVEISQFSLRYRRRQGRRWRCLFEQALNQLPPTARQHAAIQRVAAQVEWPFEYRVAQDWHRRVGTPWVAVDGSGVSRQHLPRYETELLTAENLAALVESPHISLKEYVRMEFARARRLQEHPCLRLTGEQAEGSRRRERLQAHRLRRLAGKRRRLLHFGGWEHLPAWADGSGLVNLLADLEPLFLLLDEADQLPDEGAVDSCRGTELLRILSAGCKEENHLGEVR